MPRPTDAAKITRREALRRTVLFSTAALATSGRSFLRAAPVETKFDSGGLHLLALGDYGTHGDANQISVARAMSKFAKSLDQPLTAVLALGDNFYKPITPSRFQDHFENMYSKDGLDCPFYACAGNHDYGPKYDPQEGKLQMQLDYAKNNPDSRWKFPAKWYTLELPSADKPLVKIIVLDGNYWEGALTPQEKIDQRRFFEAELKKKSDAPWLWVVNHFPLFSDGHGHGDNAASSASGASSCKIILCPSASPATTTSCNTSRSTTITRASSSPAPAAPPYTNSTISAAATLTIPAWVSTTFTYAGKAQHPIHHLRRRLHPPLPTHAQGELTVKV